MATNSTEDQNPAGGPLLDGEIRVINGHRMVIHRRGRGSGKKRYVTRCSYHCRCGYNSPTFTLNESMDKDIQRHVNENL